MCATRMRMGKDLQHVAAILHIKYNYLVAMEDGRYEDLPGHAYAIGFVRAYADHLGLDGDEIVRRFKEESTGLKNRPVFEFPVPTPDSGLPSGVLILVAIILGMAVYGLWYAIAGSGRDAVQVIQEVPDRLLAKVEPQPPFQQPTELPAGLPPATEDDIKSPPTVGVESPPPSLAPGSPGDRTSVSGVPALPAPSTDVVELRAKSDVWITLRTPANPDRTQLLQKGEVFRAPKGGDGMTLVTATPAELEILVNGEVMPALDAGVFARGVLLDAAGLRGSARSVAPRSPVVTPSAAPGANSAAPPGI